MSETRIFYWRDCEHHEGVTRLGQKYNLGFWLFLSPPAHDLLLIGASRPVVLHSVFSWMLRHLLSRCKVPGLIFFSSPVKLQPWFTKLTWLIQPFPNAFMFVMIERFIDFLACAYVYGCGLVFPSHQDTNPMDSPNLGNTSSCFPLIGWL